MNVVVLTLSTKTNTLPDGVSAGKFRFILTDSSGTPVQQDVDAPTASFSGVADGGCSATAQRLDTDGNPFGNVASLSFVAPTPVQPSTFDEPSSLTVVVTPQA
jgi:hypothetical protein